MRVSSGAMTAEAWGPEEEIRRALSEKIARGDLTLPLLPQVASQVLALVGDASVNAAQLSGLIFRDPSLAGQVLRIANSPVYMPKMPIVSLQQAVARLGLGRVTEIALSASLQSGVFKVPGYEDELKRLWRHSLVCGMFAKEVARIRRWNVESAFLCGLLHAVGKPTVLQTVVDLGRALSVSLEERQMRSLIDGAHVEVSELIAKKWHLPEQVRAAIRFTVGDLTAPMHRQDAMLTYFAAALASHTLSPDLLDEPALRHSSVIGDLNLYPDDVTALLAKRKSVLQSVDAMTL